MTASSPTASASPAGVIAGHPPGLIYLLMTEIWERFAFFGIRALLILFLIKHLGYADGEAYATQGSFFVFQHLAPIAGGLLADRALGFRRAINLGSVLMMIGPALLAMAGVLGAMEGEASALAETALFAGLAATAVGTGFIKPVTATTLGALYRQDDPDRDAGFTYFYVGINIGAFIAAAAVGYVGETWGWSLGFGVCAVAMLFGMIAYNLGGKHYADIWRSPDEAALQERRFGIPREYLIYAAAFLAAGVLAVVIPLSNLVGVALGVLALSAIGGVIAYASMRCEPRDRDRLFVAVALMLFASIFWAIFAQCYNSLMTFNDRLVDRTVLGFEIRAPQLLSLNPIFIIVLGPFFGALWMRLRAVGFAPSTVLKFSMALMLVGLAFGILGARAVSAEHAEVSVLWIVLLFFIFTIAELMLAPVGMSMITRLSPKRIAAFMMGFWFLSFSIAEFLSATLARLLAKWGARPDMPAMEAMGLYGNLFFVLASLGIASGLALLLLSAPIKKRMHGIS